MLLLLKTLPTVALPYYKLRIHWKADPEKGLPAHIETKMYKFACEAGRDHSRLLKNPRVGKIEYIEPSGDEACLKFDGNDLPVPVRVA